MEFLPKTHNFRLTMRKQRSKPKDIQLNNWLVTFKRDEVALIKEALINHTNLGRLEGLNPKVGDLALDEVPVRYGTVGEVPQLKCDGRMGRDVTF